MAKNFYFTFFILLILLNGCKREEPCDPLNPNQSLGWWPISVDNQWYYYTVNDCKQIEREGFTVSRVIPPNTEENHTDSLKMFIISPVNCLRCPENVRYGITTDGKRVYRLNLEVLDDLGASLFFDFDLSTEQSTPEGFFANRLSDSQIIFTKGGLTVKFILGIGPVNSIYFSSELHEAVLGGSIITLNCHGLESVQDSCRKCDYCDGCC